VTGLLELEEADVDDRGLEGTGGFFSGCFSFSSKSLLISFNCPRNFSFSLVKRTITSFSVVVESLEEVES
jgi:hypothetical protein